MIRFACGTCKERLVVPAHHAGRRGKCPNCGTVNRVPATSEFAGPMTAIAPAAGAAPAPVRPLELGGGLQQRQHQPEALIRAPEPAAIARQVESAPSDAPARLVEVNPFDDAGMPVWLKLLIVAAILAVLVMGVWVVFYLLIWSHLKLTS
jgi:hypothetical protein